MSSREIAALVESRHADVKRTIERLMSKEVIAGYAPMAYTHPQNGQQYDEYHVNQRDSYVIVTQLSPEFTARLVGRWQELEAQVAKPQPPALPGGYLSALKAPIPHPLSSDPTTGRNDMNNQLTTFNFKSMNVRVVEIAGEPWFVASDVYPAINLRQHGGVLNPLDASEKTKRGRTSVGMNPGRDVWLISESGLYKLIMRSDKPEAKAFQDWVTKEVLPTIRKTGSYSAHKGVQAQMGKIRVVPKETDTKDATIKMLAQAVERLTVLQANPLVVVDSDPLITLQQYEENTRQTLECAARSKREPQWKVARSQQDRRRSITEQL